MVRDRSDALRFTHVELTNWRNFTRASVKLGDRTFLVGPNASGKSNFLDAFRFLRDVAAVGGGFQAAVSSRGGVSRIRSLAARREPQIRIAVTLGTDDTPDEWTYELTFSQQARGRRLPQIENEVVKKGSKVVLERGGTGEDQEQLTQTFLEQAQSNREFREVAEFVRGVRYLHIVPQLVREPDRVQQRSNDPYGSDFLEQVAKTPERTKKARFRRITRALKVAIPQLIELEEHRDEVGVPHLRGRYEHWRTHGVWQDETQFSDGTLRLLGLLWVLQDGNGPVLLEEPELSLHPEVIRYLPQLFLRITARSRRQVLLSSHSPHIFQDPGVSPEEVLVLQPRGEGTIIAAASSITEIADILEGGGQLMDAIIPHTRPSNAHQLALFDW